MVRVVSFTCIICLEEGTLCGDFVRLMFEEASVASRPSEPLAGPYDDVCRREENPLVH